MNIEALEVGKTYKNYKELCKVLEVDEKKGGSRTSQIKDWSRYFKYSREGNAYVIEEVYSEPLPDTRKRGNNIFSDITKLLIVDMLAEENGNLTIGRTKLIKDLGIANDNYSRCRGITAKLSQYLDVDINVIYDFYNTNNSNFKSIIEKALNSLMDERRIIYHTVTKVKEIGTYVYRNATEDELQAIVTVEGNMLSKMGYKSITEVRNSKDWREFKSVSNNIIKAMTKIDYYFSAYDIIIHEERIAKGREELLELILDKSKRKEYRQEMNELIINSIDKNAKNRHNKAGIKNDNRDIVRAKNGYVDEINKLSNVLIKIDKNSISDEVNKIKVIKKIKNGNISTELDNDTKKHIEDRLDGLFD